MTTRGDGLTDEAVKAAAEALHDATCTQGGTWCKTRDIHTLMFVPKAEVAVAAAAPILLAAERARIAPTTMDLVKARFGLGLLSG